MFLKISEVLAQLHPWLQAWQAATLFVMQSRWQNAYSADVARCRCLCQNCIFDGNRELVVGMFWNFSAVLPRNQMTDFGLLAIVWKVEVFWWKQWEKFAFPLLVSSIRVLFQSLRACIPLTTRPFTRILGLLFEQLPRHVYCSLFASAFTLPPIHLWIYTLLPRGSESGPMQSRDVARCLCSEAFLVFFVFNSGPSPWFSSRGGQKPEGGATFFKHCIGCMQQPGGQTWNGGAPISNGGAGHHWTARWRRPCFYCVDSAPPDSQHLATAADKTVTVLTSRLFWKSALAKWTPRWRREQRQVLWNAPRKAIGVQSLETYGVLVNFQVLPRHVPTAAKQRFH